MKKISVHLPDKLKKMAEKNWSKINWSKVIRNLIEVKLKQLGNEIKAAQH